MDGEPHVIGGMPENRADSRRFVLAQRQRDERAALDIAALAQKVEMLGALAVEPPGGLSNGNADWAA